MGPLGVASRAGGQHVYGVEGIVTGEWKYEREARMGLYEDQFDGPIVEAPWRSQIMYIPRTDDKTQDQDENQTKRKEEQILTNIGTTVRVYSSRRDTGIHERRTMQRQFHLIDPSKHGWSVVAS